MADQPAQVSESVMYSGPTTQPPPSSAQLRRYDPQRPGGGRSSAPVEFEGALIDPEQTSAAGDVVSGEKRGLDRPDHHRTNLHPAEISGPGGGAMSLIEDLSLEPSRAADQKALERTGPADLPPPIDPHPAPEARLRALAVEARLQIARERARTISFGAAGGDAPAPAEITPRPLRERIVQMVGLPEDPGHARVHITA